MYLVQRARVLYALDRFDAAIEASAAALHAMPGSRLALLTSAAAQAALGDLAGANQRVRDVLAHSTSLRLSAPMLAPYFARDPQRRQQWLERLRAAGMPD